VLHSHRARAEKLANDLPVIASKKLFLDQPKTRVPHAGSQDLCRGREAFQGISMQRISVRGAIGKTNRLFSKTDEEQLAKQGTAPAVFETRGHPRHNMHGLVKRKGNLAYSLEISNAKKKDGKIRFSL
jgi:hypothetical protein